MGITLELGVRSNYSEVELLKISRHSDSDPVIIISELPVSCRPESNKIPHSASKINHECSSFPETITLQLNLERFHNV